jgi:hypothetical protein
MTVQLYGIGRAPVSLPVWPQILEDLGHPHPKRLARALGLGVRTVRRYTRQGHAPRPVVMALFWLTRWGRSECHEAATSDALLACGYVSALRRQVAELQSQVAHLVALQTGAANEPLIGVRL